MSETNHEPHFSIEKLYVKGVSLEVPHSPAIFLERETPELDLQLASGAQQLEEGIFENSLTVTVTAKIQEKVAFLLEATYAGIFQIRNVSQEDLEHLMGVACPNILFPYVRELVSDVTNRAGFAPVVLAPINFEVLYAQQKQQEAEGESA